MCTKSAKNLSIEMSNLLSKSIKVQILVVEKVQIYTYKVQKII